ncbi:MAG: tetratricopeptide repeat protein [Bryobacteraceae bacterium]
MTQLAFRLPLAVACLLAAGCSSATLPYVRTEGLAPEARQQIKAAQDAAHADPDNAAAVARFGRTLLAYRFDESALPCFQRARTLAPDSFRWPYYIGLIEQNRGNHRVAVDAFALCLNRKPDDPPAMLRMADSLAALENWDGAARAYQALLALGPSARAHYGLGKVYAATGQLDQAAAQFNRACGIFPRYGEARRALAAIYRKKGDTGRLQEQISFLRTGADREPPLSDPLLTQAVDLEKSASRLAKAGQRLLEAGLPKAAIRELDSALAMDPNDLGAHLYAITAYQQVDDFNTARRHYESAVTLSPDEPLAYLFRARGLLERGRYDEAREAALALISIDPSNVEASTLLGDTELALGHPGEAERHYRRAYQADPDSPAANNGLGLLLYARRDFPSALRHLVKAQNMPDSQVLPALEALAACYTATGDSAAAARALRHARAVATIHGSQPTVARINAELARLE